jgi:hypothetical protein
MKRKIMTLMVIAIMVAMAFVLTTPANAGDRKTGGPDAFDYTYYDNADGAVYNWIEIRYTGRRLSLGDDSRQYVYPPFVFEMSENSYTRVTVGSNGHIYFTTQSSRFGNYRLPYSYYSGDFICPFWDDLNPSAGGGVYWQVLGTAPNRMLVVEWWNIPHYYRTGACTFEAILYEDGTIKFQYQDVYFGSYSYDRGRSATVGIQHDRYNALQYSYNSAVLYNGLAIVFGGELAIPANVDMEPQSLNLESMGNWVQFKVYDFPENPEYTVYDIDPTQGEVAGVGADLKFGTTNENKYIGKADRLMVEDAIGAPGQEVEVEIKGAMNDGTKFKGVATIKAIQN